MLKVAIIGLGNRGNAYGNLLNKHKEVEITALCEKNDDFLKDCAKKWKVGNDRLFTREQDFFAAGRLAGPGVLHPAQSCRAETGRPIYSKDNRVFANQGYV